MEKIQTIVNGYEHKPTRTQVIAKEQDVNFTTMLNTGRDKYRSQGQEIAYNTEGDNDNRIEISEDQSDWSKSQKS